MKDELRTVSGLWSVVSCKRRKTTDKGRRTTDSFSFIISLLFASILLFSCSSHTKTEEQKSAQELTVAAAANLTDAFGELGKQFTEQTGIRVVYSFGATADLEKQIENGAPFDVFASADVEHVDALRSAGLLTEDTQAIFARGRLVLWTPQGSRVSLDKIEDITRADVERIAIAKPDVAPYGRATVEALRALKLWQGVEPKVVYAQNVSQAKQYAATGNADVAFIPLSLVHAGEGRAIEVDEHLHQPINQSIAVIKASGKQDGARRFVAFVLSTEGQALFERYGYRKPE
ncbi:MAG: molybdate ABC transporter substrate-binding protein [Pyrinomonadaceae bacterium]